MTPHTARSRPVSVMLLMLLMALTKQLRAELPVPEPMQGIDVQEMPGAQVPRDATFTNTEGDLVELSTYFDGERPLILIMAYTRCPMLCNLVLRGAIEAVPQLELALSRDFRALTILIDPEETVNSARAKQSTLLSALGRNGRSNDWPFLIGTEKQIRRVANAIGFSYRKDENSGQYAHPAVLFVLTPEGKVARYLQGIRYEPSVLRPALVEAQKSQISLSAAIGEAVLRCFRFDPALRKYGSSIETGFRVGGALLFGILLLTVGLLFRWERRRT